MRISSQASTVGNVFRAHRAAWVLCIALGLTLLPGCRLYEFLTGTGYYQDDPFLGPDCSSSMLLGGEGVMDEFDSSQPRPATPEGEPLDIPTEAPYVEEDFTGEEAPSDEGSLDRLLPPDAAAEPDTLDLEVDEPQLPAAEPPPKKEPTPEELPFSLDYTEPQPEAEPAQPEPKPPAPAQPAPTQPDETEPLEDPFPLELPKTEPEEKTEDDLEGMLDLTPTEPEPEPPQREPEPEPDSEKGLDELDLFDDEISPDLEIDFPETGGDQPAPNDGADLPRRLYPTATRPSSDSFYGRCLSPHGYRRSPQHASRRFGPELGDTSPIPFWPDEALYGTSSSQAVRGGSDLFDWGPAEPQPRHEKVGFDEDDETASDRRSRRERK